MSLVINSHHSHEWCHSHDDDWREQETVIDSRGFYDCHSQRLIILLSVLGVELDYFTGTRSRTLFSQGTAKREGHAELTRLLRPRGHTVLPTATRQVPLVPGTPTQSRSYSTSTVLMMMTDLSSVRQGSIHSHKFTHESMSRPNYP